MPATAFTELARTRPYTARKRFLEAVRRHEGIIHKATTELGMARRTGTNVVARLGLALEIERIKDEFFAVKLDRACKRRSERWHLHGLLWLAERRREREQARAAGGNVPPVGKKIARKSRKKRKKKKRVLPR
jgi:hypothetical protein